MPGRSRLLAAALASSLVAGPVMAQPKSSNRPPADVANDLVKQAITKSQQGDHLGAIDLYLAAYSLIPQHTLLSNVGNEYQQAGKPVEALKYFCMYLDKDPTGTNATYATSKAKALQIELGKKNVDDKNVCKPDTEEAPEGPPDGPPAGGGVTGTQGLDKPDRPEKPEPASPGRGLKLAGVGIGAVGLVGLGVGTFYGLKAQEKSDIISNHDRTMPWPDDIRQIEADGAAFEKRQILLTIAGGALTATGVVLFIIGATRSSPSSTEKLSVRPLATPDSLGIALGRGF